MEKNNSSDKKPESTGKGTGMSSEAGADQTEESWQGTGGGNFSEAQRKSMNAGSDNEIPKGSTNMSNSGMSNQSNNSDADLENEDIKKSGK